MLSKKDEPPMALGSRYSLCIWKIYFSKRNPYLLLRNGCGDMRTYWRLRSKRTIFNKVREISILSFVNLYTPFVNLSKKNWHNSYARWPCCMKLLAMQDWPHSSWSKHFVVFAKETAQKDEKIGVEIKKKLLIQFRSAGSLCLKWLNRLFTG